MRVTFKWGEEQHTAIQGLKSLITQAKTLGYFRGDFRTGIVVDASPVGLGAVPTHEQGGTWRAVSYASRSFTDVERCYSHKEKEEEEEQQQQQQQQLSEGI